MRYYNYLTENKENITELCSLIKDKCKPFLKDWNGYNFLLRGMRKLFDYDVLQVKKDRRPKDMPLELHNIFDNAFQKKFGWKARSNSVFCTGNQVNTEEYGNCFVIFPIGNYQYISSPIIEDLYVLFSSTSTLNSELFIKHFGDDIYNNYSAIDELYNRGRKDSQFMKIMNEYVIDLVKTYKNKNINKMIMQGNEIMINCNEYIAFSYYKYDIQEIKKQIK